MVEVRHLKILYQQPVDYYFGPSRNSCCRLQCFSQLARPTCTSMELCSSIAATWNGGTYNGLLQFRAYLLLTPFHRSEFSIYLLEYEYVVTIENWYRPTQSQLLD